MKNKKIEKLIIYVGKHTGLEMVATVTIDDVKYITTEIENGFIKIKSKHKLEDNEHTFDTLKSFLRGGMWVKKEVTVLKVSNFKGTTTLNFEYNV